MPRPRGTLRPVVLRWVLRIAALAAAVVLLHFALQWLQGQIAHLPVNTQKFMVNSFIVAVLLAYGLLIAVPFVPAVEIGVSLLLLGGPSMAPLVYLATVLGLGFAYFLGRRISLRWLRRLFIDLGQMRAARFIRAIEKMSPQERLARLQEKAPPWLARLVVRWRYGVLAVLLNLPGNLVIGGGGGIMILAGLTRVFSPLATIVTLMAGVLPVPLAVWFFGVDLFAR